MQTPENFFIDIHKNISEWELKNLVFPLQYGEKIFFYGDLWAGKSTFIRMLIRAYLDDSDMIIRSPTYTYYQKYWKNIYHFDLYRVENEEDLFLIGASDILENPENICLIEWPEILGNTVIPTKKISLTINKKDLRDIEIIDFLKDPHLVKAKSSNEL